MKSKQQIEFGDFQTPSRLAAEVCRVLNRQNISPVSIVEPTCGVGQFLEAALNAFPNFEHACAVELNPAYLRQAKERIGSRTTKVSFREADFFETDWERVLGALPDPLLVLGNPPWVCNSELGVIGGRNLPTKSNAARSRGIDAITGKSNFDVSEWMIVRLLDALLGRTATLSMLCKTSVARKVLARAWQHNMPMARASLHRIDAQQTFGVAVDACLLTVELGQSADRHECCIFDHLDSRASSSSIGMRQGRLVADVTAYDRWKSLFVGSSRHWRSGIKHDCAKIMELRREGNRYRNGLGELVDLESRYLYPMLKSSEIASTGNATPTRWMLVPQQSVGEETDSIQQTAPKTWHYLQSYRERLDRRASSIYRGKPPFSIFGVGPYTFAPWKVAISGLYKELSFTMLGPYQGKPVVLDDTCYLLSFANGVEAERVSAALNSKAARSAVSSNIFWDAKRPVTAAILNLVDIDQLLQLTTDN